MRSLFTAIAVIFVACGFVAAQESERFAQFESRTYRESDQSLSYRLLIPKAYRPGETAPLIVWLHGSGEVGNNNTTQLRGIPTAYAAAGREKSNGPAAARLASIDLARYRLKAADGADPTIAPLLASIGKGETRGTFRVTGTIELSDYAWLRVEQAEKAD